MKKLVHVIAILLLFSCMAANANRCDESGFFKPIYFKEYGVIVDIQKNVETTISRGNHSTEGLTRQVVESSNQIHGSRGAARRGLMGLAFDIAASQLPKSTSSRKVKGHMFIIRNDDASIDVHFMRESMFNEASSLKIGDRVEYVQRNNGRMEIKSSIKPLPGTQPAPVATPTDQKLVKTRNDVYIPPIVDDE